jgi:Na+/proline symporter
VQVHTAIILIIIFVFWFRVYATGDQIGSPAKMWDLLHEAAERNDYSAPTKDGSYLTIRSLGALKFAILSILEYTGVVFLDNSFHQKGIAADPASAVPGYVLGGLAWYAMPFTLATTMGIAAIALENTPAFPTFPNRMSTAEISAGLTLPYAAQTIAGTGGAGAVLVLMFMSCTSAISSQLIGVSTVLSYDVYKTCEWHSSPSSLVQTLIKITQT